MGKQIRSLALTVLTVMFVACLAVPSQAAVIDQAIQATNGPMWTNVYYRGVAGLIYAYPAPAGFTGVHVSSIYSSLSTDSYIEVGIVHDPTYFGSSTPRLFIRYETPYTGGQQDGGYHAVDANSWYNAQIYETTLGSGRGEWIAGHDNEIEFSKSLSFNRGNALSSAERASATTTWNLASFNTLQKRSSTGAWSLWDDRRNYDNDYHWRVHSGTSDYRWYTEWEQ